MSNVKPLDLPLIANIDLPHIFAYLTCYFKTLDNLTLGQCPTHTHLYPITFIIVPRPCENQWLDSVFYTYRAQSMVGRLIQVVACGYKEHPSPSFTAPRSWRIIVIGKSILKAGISLLYWFLRPVLGIVNKIPNLSLI